MEKMALGPVFLGVLLAAFLCIISSFSILYVMLIRRKWTGIAHAVKRLATGWTVGGSNPSGAKFSASLNTSLGAHKPPKQWEPEVKCLRRRF